MFLSARLFTAHSFASDWGNPLTVCSVCWNETSQWFRRLSLRSCTRRLSHEACAFLPGTDRNAALCRARAVPMCPSSKSCLFLGFFFWLLLLCLYIFWLLLSRKRNVSVINTWEVSRNAYGFVLILRGVWFMSQTQERADVNVTVYKRWFIRGSYLRCPLVADCGH